MRYLATALIFAFAIATITKPTCSGGTAAVIVLWGVILTLCAFFHDNNKTS